MKIHFSHPYINNVDIKFNRFTQIVGQNQELQHYIWQILIWYFGGKRYSEVDLNLFNQTEPILENEEKVLSRKYFNIVSVSNIEDLIHELSLKKGTIAYHYFKKNMNSMEIISDIDLINLTLEKISDKVTRTLALNYSRVSYEVDSVLLNRDYLTQKLLTPRFNTENGLIPLEFVNNETKLTFLLEMIESILTYTPERLLIVFKNMDDYLDYDSFIRVCNRIDRMTHDYHHFNCLIFPSNESYLYVTAKTIDSINIVSDRIESLHELEFFYDRFIKMYPSNNIPTIEEFLSLIQKNSSYLFTQKLNHISLGIDDLVAIKIINKLYQYDSELSFKKISIDPLALKYLNNGD